MEHGRRSIRLHGYDYTLAGAYFLTICTQERQAVLGAYASGTLRASPAGLMVQQTWEELPGSYGVAIDAFVVMPDHLHGILVLPGGGLSLPAVVQRFKSLTTQRYSAGVRQAGWPPFVRRLWQRGYYERVIRSDPELEVLRAYIAANPDQLLEQSG